MRSSVSQSTIKSIPLADITDGGAQMRVEITEQTVFDYAEDMAAELMDRKPDISDIEEPRPRPAQEPELALFDSKRDYLTQLDAYHEWQRRDGASS